LSARRSIRHRDWPPHLYEDRKGYYVFRYMRDGVSTCVAIGRKPLAVAISEAIAANLHLASEQPSLVDKLKGAHHTVADVIAKMPAPKSMESQSSYRSWDRVISEKLGAKQIKDLTVDDCAQLIDAIHASGRETTAKYVRSRLVMLCRRAQQLGWVKPGVNVAAITAEPAVEVRRQRMTLDTFMAIHKVAHQAAGWLPRAMMYALVTGQDRSTVCAMEHAHVVDGELRVWRNKTRRTNTPVAIPLRLRLDAVGVSLGELIEQPTGVQSRFLVHHPKRIAHVHAGDPVSPDAVTEAFARARVLAKITGPNPPSFHEIRSLSKRLYLAQGGVDTQALLGHKDAGTAALYADPRGAEPIRVRVD
jgi:integrase